MLGTQAMMVASYFSTGSIEEELFAHYGNSSRFFVLFCFVFVLEIFAYSSQILLSLYTLQIKNPQSVLEWFAISMYPKGINFARRNLFQNSIWRFIIQIKYKLDIKFLYIVDSCKLRSQTNITYWAYRVLKRVRKGFV